MYGKHVAESVEIFFVMKLAHSFNLYTIFSTSFSKFSGSVLICIYILQQSESLQIQES